MSGSSGPNGSMKSPIGSPTKFSLEKNSSGLFGSGDLADDRTKREKHPKTAEDVNAAIEMSYKYVIDNESDKYQSQCGWLIRFWIISILDFRFWILDLFEFVIQKSQYCESPM